MVEKSLGIEAQGFSAQKILPPSQLKFVLLSKGGRLIVGSPNDKRCFEALLSNVKLLQGGILELTTNVSEAGNLD